MPTLTIIRGVSGSGKTTLAKLIAYQKYVSGVLCEADQFFEDLEGNYNFDASKLKEAHAYCKRQVEYFMQTPQLEQIVVSNTFTRKWEYEPYVDLADAYNYDLQIITVQANFGSIHDVPEDVIQMQRDRWEY
jgi:uridine kinase